jgi:hypothetical protein
VPIRQKSPLGWYVQHTTRSEERARAPTAAAPGAPATPPAPHEALEDRAAATARPLLHVPAEPVLQELLVLLVGVEDELAVWEDPWRWSPVSATDLVVDAVAALLAS